MPGSDSIGVCQSVDVTHVGTCRQQQRHNATVPLHRRQHQRCVATVRLSSVVAALALAPEGGSWHDAP